MTTIHSPLTGPPVLRVAPRGELSERPEVAIALGEAPDGLPLLLHVVRRGSVRNAVVAALGYREILPSEVESRLTALEEAVARAARSAGIEPVNDTLVYLTSASVGQLFGLPLLARILGAESPIVLAEDRYTASARPELVAHTAAVAHAPAPVTLMKGLKTHRHVAVPLRPGPVFLAEPGVVDAPMLPGNGHGRNGRNGSGGSNGHALADQPVGIDPQSLEPLRFEDLRGLPSARWMIGAGDGTFDDRAPYLRALQAGGWAQWLVSAGDVVRLIGQVARSLQMFHDEGRVHCDVKPANTLVTAQGAVAIDPIGVAVGRVSPGVTPTWAAPEQLLAQPVVPGTDVYALALMLAQLLRAAIYGEERSFLIPVGGNERRRVRVLGDPEVFVDPSVIKLDDEGRQAWGDLIRQCVAFDPDDRPQNAAAFADEVEQLAQDHPLDWELPAFRPGPGDLAINAEVEGSVQPAWVITDRRL
jgi:hypothetical protein